MEVDMRCLPFSDGPFQGAGSSPGPPMSQAASTFKNIGILFFTWDLIHFITKRVDFLVQWMPQNAGADH